MDTLIAAARGRAARSAGNKEMIFDWNEAAKRIVASGAMEASAGLRGDWEWTGGSILKDGKPIPKNETYVYLTSIWAIPELDIGNGPEPCFYMEGNGPEWDAKTYWPPSAREILTSMKVE